MRTTKRIAVVLVGLSLLPVSACAMPGSPEAKKILAQQKANENKGKTSAKAQTPDDGSEDVAAEGASITSVKVVDDGKNGTVLSLGARNATITRSSGGVWNTTLTDADEDMMRFGKGYGAITPTKSFISNPKSLNVGFEVVNGVITGLDGSGRPVAYLVALQPPKYVMRGSGISFETYSATQGHMSGTLLTAAQQRKDAYGNAYVNGLPDGVPSVSLVDVRLYLDTKGVKSIGNCLLVPATKCVGLNGDLYRADLTDADLTGADFHGSNLSSSTMRGADFDGADFTKTKLFRSDATKSSWVRANLTSANSHQVTYTGSTMTYVEAGKADMFRSELDKADISAGKFVSTGLQQVTMRDATARYVDFTKANLFRAEMSRSDFLRSTFEEANMAQVIAMNAKFNRVKASEADMSAIDARSADFSGADLSGVQFSKATLKDTNFTGADLRGANMFQADINGAIFTGAKTEGMTCPNGDIIGKTIIRKGWKNKWNSGRTLRLKQCRPVYREVDNTTAEGSGTRGK